MIVQSLLVRKVEGDCSIVSLLLYVTFFHLLRHHPFLFFCIDMRRLQYELLYDFAVCSMGPILYDSVFFFMLSLFLEEDAASQERVSSTVGAPCNEVSLCNRAGELGLGDVEPRIG